MQTQRAATKLSPCDSRPVRCPPTPQQAADLASDRNLHRQWLASNGLSEPAWDLPEDPYTGLLLAALLDPFAQQAVLRALAAGDPPRPPSRAVVTAVRWPTRGVDLVILQGAEADVIATLVEHKRFRSPSHAPGYKKDPDAAWQTDQAFEASQAAEPPGWLDGIEPGHSRRYLVLDAYGKDIDQLFPGGTHNSEWTVTGYGEFGSALREAHKQGTPGLGPLLTTLYAGSP